MFRFADLRVLLLIGALQAVSCGAQTIGDYSRAQRAAIDGAIARSNGRIHDESVAPVAPKPAVSPAAGSASSATTSVARDIDDGGTPDVGVGGVFISATHVVAEVLVEGVPYFVAQGQRIPGTDWSVSSIAADKVVIGRKARMRGERAMSRSFPLMSMER